MRRQAIGAVLDRHRVAVLQFSGGKDSLACLHLLRPYWSRIVVLWANPGAPLPEVVEQMRAVRALVPHFVEVAGSQPEHIERCGYPLDVVPAFATAQGQALTAGADGQRFQSVIECCAANLWRPMHEATLGLGATLIIRGQREAEALRARTRSGQVHDGIELLYPIEQWSDDDVSAYLGSVGAQVPGYYARGLTSSPDCWSCTAYGAHLSERARYLAQHHPKKWRVIRPVLAVAREAIRQDHARLDAALDEDILT